MGRPKKEKPIVESPVKTTEEVGYALPTGAAISRDNIQVKITDEEREKFYKCFIADLRFDDIKELFDGKIKVTFQSITVNENNDIWRQIDLDSKAGLIGTNEAYLLLINIYRLAMSLCAIDGVPFASTDITKENFVKDKDKPNTTYVRAKADKFKDWDTFKLSVFIRSFGEFESKLFQLEKDVTTQNFWKATE